MIHGWARIRATCSRRFASRSGKAWSGEVDVAAGLLDQRRDDGGVLEREHPAAGVLDDDDLLGAEEVLADDQRADRVVGREAAGVADDVGVAAAQAEDVLDRQPRVHAGEDGELPAGREREPERSNWAA